MTQQQEKELKTAGEILTDLGLDIVGLAALTYDAEVLDELIVNINHLDRVTASLRVLCLSMQQPQVNTLAAYE
jgi:hypothetical protein